MCRCVCVCEKQKVRHGDRPTGKRQTYRHRVKRVTGYIGGRQFASYLAGLNIVIGKHCRVKLTQVRSVNIVECDQQVKM